MRTSATKFFVFITRGTIHYVSGNTSEVDADLHFGGAGALLPGATTKFTNSNTATAAPNLAYQTDNLTIGFLPEQIQINRHGGPGVQLTGNVDFSASIKVDRASKGNLFSFSLDPATKAKKAAAKLTAQPTMVPRAPKDSKGKYVNCAASGFERVCDIQADVVLNYVVRHVTAEFGSNVPGTRTVTCITKDAKDPDALLIPWRDLHWDYFGVALSSDPDLTLQATPKLGGMPVNLYFSDIETANQFVDYLRQAKVSKIGDIPFRLPNDGGPLKPVGKTQFAKLVRVRCDPSAES